MASILVTGGTGLLGVPTVARLCESGHAVRSLSRRSGPGLVTGDLTSGAGIPEALGGVETVLHLATSRGRQDVALTRTLLRVARAAGVSHIVLISIVGIDEVPMGYYRDKVEVERVVAESSLPYTTLRATQFHNLFDQIFSAQRLFPVLLAPALVFQPIDVTDVARRLVELAESGPAGRVADIGGPDQRAAGDLAKAWARANGSGRRVASGKLPGKIFAGYASGAALVPGPGYGTVTFEQYLANR